MSWWQAAVAGYGIYKGSQTPDRPGLGRAREATRQGHQLDQDFTLGTEQKMFDRASERGMTPQEYYGSSAPGGSKVSGGAQVLGNNSTQIEAQAMQDKRQQRQAHAERSTRLLQTQMTTDAQIKSAQISAGTATRGQDITESTTKRGQDINQATTTRGQDLQNAIASKNYVLAKKQLANQTRKLQADLKISRQQFIKLTNEIATSDPKFQLYITKLKMGVDNMVAEFLQNSYGINILDKESVQAMSTSQRAKFIQEIAGLNSFAFKEASGISLAAERTGNRILGGIRDSLPNIKMPNITLGNKTPAQGGYARQPNYHRDNRYN